MRAVRATPVRVSIHTLTRRVTTYRGGVTLEVAVSIHTLTRRVTKLLHFSVLPCDVSIHTLTRRVTSGRIGKPADEVFQSTPSRGG